MRRPFFFLWLLITSVLIFCWVYLPSLSHYRDLKERLDDLDEQLGSLTDSIHDLREERDLLKNDVDYLEKVIRDEMGLVKPGEIIYKFIQENPEALVPGAPPVPTGYQAAEGTLIPPASQPPSPAVSNGQDRR